MKRLQGLKRRFVTVGLVVTWPVTPSLPLSLAWFGKQRRVDPIWCQSSDGEQSGGALRQRPPTLQPARHQFLLQDVQTQRLQLTDRRHRDQIHQRPTLLGGATQYFSVFISGGNKLIIYIKHDSQRGDRVQKISWTKLFSRSIHVINITLIHWFQLSLRFWEKHPV